MLAIEAAHQMHLTGDWVVPRLAGEPWIEDPPLYYWIALVFGKLLGGLLGFHNAVRIASGIAVLAAVWFLFFTAKALSSESEKPTVSASAALLMVGSIGLIVHAHEAVPDLAALAAACAGFYFLFEKKNPAKAGLGFGTSLGLAFLATGLVIPVVLGATALIAHLACAEWRTRDAPRFLGAAAVAFLVLALSWPLMLWLRAPDVAQAWWYHATHARGDFLPNLRYYLSTASWFAWPAWLLAAWACWSLRRALLAPRLFVPLAAALLALVAICWVGPRQDINNFVLLPPLALLGAQGVPRLRRGAANALDWFGVMTFSVFAGLVWLGYVAMMTGFPPRIANNFFKTAPGYVARFELLPFIVALALTLGWLYIAFLSPRSPSRGVTRWAAGVTLLWGSFATLLLPWADHLKSYRSVALQLKSVVPANSGCIARGELGDPQRAALSYHAGLRTVPQQAASANAPACRLLLVQGSPRQEITPGPGWRKLADIGRPGDRGERYRLYRLP